MSVPPASVPPASFPLDGVSLDEPLLDGPRLRPKAGGQPEQLVVLLHGYGADGRDLIDLGHAWADLLPRAAFVAPHAPEPCAQAPVGRQWFPLTFRDPHELPRGAAAAAPLLRAFLEAELAKLGLPPQRLALVGFSQGAMMALKVGLGDGLAPAAVVAFSGMWVDASTPREIPFADPPPVLMLHGEDDEVIPAQALFGSARALAAAGVPVEWHLSLGLGHGIDDAEVSIAGAFLAQSLDNAVG